MPLPVAVAAVGRLIASKGVQQAIKEVGKKAVDEYRKMSAKASNKLDKAQGIKPSSPGRTSQNRGVVVGKDRTKAFKNTEQIKGGVKGAAVAGAAGAAAGAALKKNKDEKPKAAPKAKAKPKKSSTPSGPPKAKAKPKSTPSGPPTAKKKAEKGTRVVGDKTGVKVYKDGKLVSNRKKKK